MKMSFCWVGLAASMVPVVAQAAAPAVALEAGLAAYQAGDFAGARRYLRPLADRGSAIAETMLGVMAARGEGRAADPAAAAGWWLRAANRGYAPAQLAMAKALAAGQGVTADTGQAWIWARLAAGAGNGVADEAKALAASLAAGLDQTQLAALEAERAAWRPWPAP
jgi:TPR repeat protein